MRAAHPRSLSRVLAFVAVLAVVEGCGEPTALGALGIDGEWTATVPLAKGHERMSMKLARDANPEGIAGSGLWFDKHRLPPFDVENLTISGSQSGNTVTLIMRSEAGSSLGTLNFSGSVGGGGNKIVGDLGGPRWAPAVRVEFVHP
jgi:hypothetical protein